MRKRIFDHMLRTRSWKYRAFLIYLRLFKYFAFSKTRGEFLESYYTLMRYLDDIVDGDLPLPAHFQTSEEYIQTKIQFARNPKNPKDEADYLMIYCFELAEKFNEDFNQETEDILRSLLFDARRFKKGIIFPEKELIEHFHLMDIRGTIRATLKVFNEDPEKYKLLEPLGLASRYQFDLEDFQDDIKAGYINISLEECESFNIRHEDLQDINSESVNNWFIYRAKRGLELLEEHRRMVKKEKFSLLARATFPLVYANPAKRRFNKVLNHLSNSRKMDYGKQSRIQRSFIKG